MKRILIVEDDASVSDALKSILEAEAFACMIVTTVEAARLACAAGCFDLILLDLGLPDGEGLDLLPELRARFPSLPIMIVTAMTEESSAVQAFARGATDYVRKPFGKRELVARIRACLNDIVRNRESLRFGKLQLDLAARKAHVEGKELRVRRAEFELLVLLVRRAGEVVTREELVRLFDPEARSSDRLVDSRVSRLRKILSDAGITALAISPIYGTGYRIDWLK